MGDHKRNILIIALPLLAALLVVFLLPVNIEGTTHPRVETVTYILPDGFEGVVLVRFGAANPGSFVSNGNAAITVPADGMVKAPFAMPGYAHVTRARFASGEYIPRPADQPPPETVALYPLSTFGDVHARSIPRSFWWAPKRSTAK